MSDIKELQKIADEWVEAFVAHDIDGIAKHFLKEAAVYQPEGREAEGLNAVISTQKGWLELGETNKKVEVIDGRISGDVAYYIARYSGDYPNEDGSTYTDSGVCVGVYHKDDEGNWRGRVMAMTS
jgi:ketosteroid isomerase-like protein